MLDGIPPKKVSSEEAMKKKRRLYVEPTREDHLRFQEEAFNRDMAPHDLGGILINLWIKAGCPDQIVSATELTSNNH